MREVHGLAMNTLWSYCQKGRYTDIEIVCQGGTLLAHKVMLSKDMPILKEVETDLIIMPGVPVKHMEQELEKLYKYQPVLFDVHEEPVKEDLTLKTDKTTEEVNFTVGEEIDNSYMTKS